MLIVRALGPLSLLALTGALVTASACSSFTSEEAGTPDASDGSTMTADATVPLDGGPDADGAVGPGDAGPDGSPAAFPITLGFDSQDDCDAWTGVKDVTFTFIPDGRTGAGACRLCGAGADPETPYVYLKVPAGLGQYSLSAYLRAPSPLTLAAGQTAAPAATIGFSVTSENNPLLSTGGGRTHPVNTVESWVGGRVDLAVSTLAATDGSPAVVHATLELDKVPAAMTYCVDIDDVVITFDGK